MNRKEFLLELGLPEPKTPDDRGRLETFLKEIVRAIPFIEARVFRLSIGLDEREYSKEQVIEILGLTPQRMLEIEAKILARFRTPERLERLRAALSV